MRFSKGPAKNGKTVGIRKSIAYLLFILVVTVFFLYLSFPGYLVGEYLKNSVEQQFPSVSLKIDRVAPSLPVGLLFQQPRVIKKNNPSIFLFEADSFVIMPSTKMVVTGRPAVGFDCHAYGGRIEGVTFFDRFAFGPPFHTDIELLNLQIRKYVFLKERLNRELSGVMSGTVKYQCLGTAPLRNAGEADISIQNGSIGFIEPFLGLSSFDFDRIDAQLELKGETLIVKKASFKGSQIVGEGMGAVALGRPLPHSGLDLTVDIRPAPGFLEKNKAVADAARVFLKRLNGDRVTLKIKGTLAQPRTSFM